MDVKMGKKTQEKAEEGKKTTASEMTPEERAAEEAKFLELVSYTHLDVYKRQFPEDFRFFCGCSGAGVCMLL